MSTKKKIIILVSICLIILVLGIIIDFVLSNKNNKYLILVSADEVSEKVNNKESFVLLLSQTTCGHCAEYKPKLREVANQYKLEVYYIEVNLLTDSERNEFKKMFSYDGTPTTIFVHNGEEITQASRIEGNASKEKIINKLKSNGFID